mgnify:CR=1 FL=1
MSDRELLEPVEVVGYLNTATDEVVKYGPTLIVAYSELPQAQQSKDYLFKAVIHQLSSFLSI